MRCFALLFLLLAAERAPFGRHHPMPASWQLHGREASSLADFGRRFRHKEQGQLPREEIRVDNFELGNGGRIGFGLVHGRHAGIRLKLPF